MTLSSRSRFMQSTYPIPPAPIETEFDKLLREAHISPIDAHKYLMVKQWVYRNHRSKYCPIAVLEACGIQPEDCV
jgi:hypothetical protein